MSTPEWMNDTRRRPEPTDTGAIHDPRQRAPEPDNRARRKRITQAAIGIVILALIGTVAIFYQRALRHFPIQFDAVIFLEYSPDGKHLTAITNDSELVRPHYTTHILDAEGEKKLFTMEPGGAVGAWNSDGTLFAAARAVFPMSIDQWSDELSTPAIELWDTKDWTAKQTLQIPRLPDGILDVGCVCFDRFGNVYAATHPSGDWHDWSNRARMWSAPNPRKAAYDETSTEIGDASAVSITSGLVGEDARLVIGYAGEEPIQVFRGRQDSNGDVVFTKEYTLPAMKHAYVRLTPDGQFLCAANGDEFYLFKLLEVRAEKLVEIREQSYQWNFFAFTPSGVSHDGRHVAHLWSMPGIVRVFDTSDGETVLSLPHATPFAISPDSKKIAYVNEGRIAFRRIPLVAAQFRD